MANWDHQSNIGTHPRLHDGAHNGLAQFTGGGRVTLADVADTHVPVGSLVTVTIGRDVQAHSVHAADDAAGVGPMHDTAWANFRNNVRNTLEGLDVQLVCDGFIGHGEWEGHAEESAAFVGLATRPFDPTFLGELLECQARRFSQDAIGWSYGPGNLARRSR